MCEGHCVISTPSGANVEGLRKVVTKYELL